MKRNIILTVCFLLFVSLAMPTNAALVQCIPTGPDDSTICGWCDFIATIQTTFYFIIGIAFLGAVILIAKYGLDMYFTGGNPGKVQEALKGIGKIVVGLIIILISWAIINTIMWLLGGSANWWKISC
ncbi:MAG: hypothetical protein A2418_01895 [Candidatus Brennerbacteria bacterium RIFOXYC1_FULL_41_11]|uniref:Uncharacterized protein n=1 Tax=Candidatus Brennerbacteria bacterium RIFOXYD1_FULL_41_16 TaxID=1797529 RepID=A0A1G1XLC0_9BACT|nr:MAG: hypothetical protein A2391_01250 [Candidatus Brennerbacteria bacterium RIFOXYB1_FULL_41_13]OGY39903.1 MAG: hypothetical protein A2418_01895 [Candidatus Brennerbacteria bacterium RIFOXYC1_FULL_41_11]OGY40714.1 MAG: hypothetical protein A2570_01110 [Candidatus Brennerbacteria bacterium RIFOXYD1_FULL_41_16]